MGNSQLGLIGWSIGLWALSIVSAPRNTHWESSKARDARVLIVGGKEWKGSVARREHSIWIVDSDNRAVENFDATVEI